MTSPEVRTSATWPEVYAVLAVGVLPNLLSVLACFAANIVLHPYWVDALQLTGLSLCAIYVTLYLIWRSGDPWARFGIERPDISDLFMGLAMFVASIAVLSAHGKISLLDDDTPTERLFPRPTTSYDLMLMPVKLVICAYAEELICRAYLITRLEVLVRSSWKALVLSAMVFSSYHIYQGLSGAVFAMLFGMTFGLVYLVVRRIWPLVLGHAGYNLFIEVLDHYQK